MENKLWRFIDNCGAFTSDAAHRIKALYFPLANEQIKSSITPDLHGDIKRDERSFLLEPVSRIDLVNSRSSRNFWIYINKNKVWSATGVSKDAKRISQDKFQLEAGLLWQKIKRENKKIGLRAEILSFVPASNEPAEIMLVTLTNISGRRISLIPTAAIPMYARAAHNIRDHRHVTSLLQRIILNRFGVISKPTLIFDEAGHRPNKTHYFVLGCGQNGNPPRHIYPTEDMFCGEAGDLEAPESVLNNALPKGDDIQGRDGMGALRFAPCALAPGKSFSYIVLMGITDEFSEIKRIFEKFNTLKKVGLAFEQTKDFWIKKSSQAGISTGNADFDNWMRWVSIQPTLRRIFGCSYLPDFDYGKGGRGWRDLWQDCLGLIHTGSEWVRETLIHNFSGVRIDGSNATIIGQKPGEFIADRNNISRVWMDHGVWPLLTLSFYLEDAGDYKILLNQTTYFRDPQIHRAHGFDRSWKPADGHILKTADGEIYRGTILEHLLVQTLVQFFNVGEHNHVRLEGADWNDGLDMAKERGESAAFSCMYALNLRLLAELIEKLNIPAVKLAAEIALLLKPINYNSVSAKRKVLQAYFLKAQPALSGRTVNINSLKIAQQLCAMSKWMTAHIRRREWLKEGFFNGYYDNRGQRVEGTKLGTMRMCLASQVFAIMSGVAEDWQIKKILESINKYLRDKKLGGYHLNTDFKSEQHNLGRAFSFVYGDKENGAYFNHMSVMLAYALLARGFTKEGEEVLRSIYRMAMDTKKSKIYPCLPEYFNLKGRGMYSYLTGSASWFMFCLLA